MKFGSLTLTVPALFPSDIREAETYGAVVWLWTQTRQFRDLPLRSLPSLLEPALRHRQFVLASEHEGRQFRPVAFVSWANLSAEAESRYLQDPAVPLRPEDWTSGDRMWALDWVTPFGHSRQFFAACRQVLAQSCMRSIYHRGEGRGLRVMTFRGNGVTQAQSRQWWRERPMLSCP